MIPNLSLTGSVLCRKHGLATFVHERLQWSRVDQSPNQSETKWLCVKVAGYKITNVCKHSTLTTHTYGHPGAPAPQPECWRLQLPTCQPGLQHNITWQLDPGLLGKSQQFCSVVWPKWSRQFLLSLTECQHKPGPGLCECQHDRRVLGTFPRSQHRPSLIIPRESKFLPTAIRWSVGTFARLIGNFRLLTGESVKILWPPYTTNIEKADQELCGSLLLVAKYCIPCGRHRNYVPCYDKESETLYRCFIRAPVGTDSDRAASFVFSMFEQKKQERWEESVNSIDFSLTLLTLPSTTPWQLWLDACVLQQQTTFQSSQSSNLLSVVALEAYAVPWRLDTCSTHRLPVHRLHMHVTSERDTQLYPPHNNTSVWLTSTHFRSTRRITNGMRCGRTTIQGSALSSPTPANTHQEQPSQKKPGSVLISLRIGVGRFRSCLYKWSMASSAACECGAEEQTVDHVALQCPIHRPPFGLPELTGLDDETIECLLNTCPEI